LAHGEERRRLVLGAEIEVGVEGDFEPADAVVAGVAVEVSAGAAVAGASAAAGHGWEMGLWGVGGGGVLDLGGLGG